MANYDNIKPYADFAHEAAPHGGVKKYLDEIADANRQLGILEEKDTEGWKAALLLGAGLILWEGGKASIRGIRRLYAKRKEEKKEELLKKSDEAKAAIVEGVKKANCTLAENVEGNDVIIEATEETTDF